MNNNNKKFYTVNDLLEILPLGRNKVYQLVQLTHFPKVKLGKKIIIPVEQFHTWFDENLGKDISLS